MKNKFDVIIVDSSDPVGCLSVLCFPRLCFPGTGPADVLFKEAFYQTMKEALRAGEIVCCQVIIFCVFCCSLFMLTARESACGYILM